MEITLKGKGYLFGKCHGSGEEERRIPAVDLVLKGLEGWLEAGLVEMEEGKRGKLQSGKVQSLRDSLHVEAGICAHYKCVYRGGGWDNERKLERLAEWVLCSTYWRFRILFSSLWAAIGRF